MTKADEDGFKWKDDKKNCLLISFLSTSVIMDVIYVQVLNYFETSEFRNAFLL